MHEWWKQGERDTEREIEGMALGMVADKMM